MCLGRRQQTWHVGDDHRPRWRLRLLPAQFPPLIYPPNAVRPPRRAIPRAGPTVPRAEHLARARASNGRRNLWLRYSRYRRAPGFSVSWGHARGLRFMSGQVHMLILHVSKFHHDRITGTARAESAVVRKRFLQLPPNCQWVYWVN